MPARGTTTSPARPPADPVEASGFRPEGQAGTLRAEGARVHALDRSLARALVRATRGSVAVVLWDGEVLRPADTTATRVRVADRAALLRLLIRPGMAFGDLYTEGRVGIEGDLLDGLERVYRAVPWSRTVWRLPESVVRLMHRPSLSRARSNIHHHYDLSNEFYSLWLDRAAMQYTCAYYPDPTLTLEAAQRAKMEHVCRKVWLGPGDRVVEAGCGWGGLALYMAARCGARVRAFNISREQVLYARERARSEGLADRVEFIEDDYRNITGRYDAFVSVGMLEHVGPGNYAELGRVIDRCVVSDGRGLIHSIGRDRPAPLNPWIRSRIFPGAYPPTLREMLPLFESSGLSVLDVENLRLHYAATLRHWLERFEQQAGRVRTMFGERFVRAWRLYLAGSVAGFSTGTLQLFQVVFARTGGNRLPMSRQHVYTDATGAA